MMILVLAFESHDDQQKFEYLYNRYSRLMLHKAYEILRDAMLAEDAASEAFIRVYKNLHKIGDPSSNSAVAFLVTIVKNVSLTMLRKRGFVVEQEPDDGQADAFNLEDSVVSKLLAENIYALLGQLGEETKSVFLLKYAHDLSHKEIGEIMQMSENSVAVRLHRARERLSKMLVGEEVSL